MIRRNTLFATLLAPALVLAATPAMAQVCFGIPMSAGQTAVGLNAAFPEGANAFGIDGRHKLTDNLVLGAGYTLTSIDSDGEGDIPSQHAFEVLGAYEFVVQGGADGPQIGVCPNIAPQYAKQDDYSATLLPLGVGIGSSFPIGQTAVIAPYANPALFFGKYKVDDFESDWENDFGFTLGANVIVTNLHFGATYTKVGDGDGAFGVRAGLVF